MSKAEEVHDIPMAGKWSSQRVRVSTPAITVKFVIRVTLQDLEQREMPMLLLCRRASIKRLREGT